MGANRRYAGMRLEIERATSEDAAERQNTELVRRGQKRAVGKGSRQPEDRGCVAAPAAPAPAALGHRRDVTTGRVPDGVWGVGGNPRAEGGCPGMR